MQGKTHRVGGALSAVLGFTILKSSEMLLPDVNPILQLIVMYPFAIYGSTVSDLDHNWNSAPSKDPISKGINTLLHLTSKVDKSGKKFSLLGIFDAKHRSWQTHSDVFLLLFMFLGIYVGNMSIGNVNIIIFKLVILGFILGIISHLLLDALTPEGIWFLIPSICKKRKVTFRLVPKTRTTFFSTGGPWETIVRKVLWVVTILLLVYIAYDLCPYKFRINYS